MTEIQHPSPDFYARMEARNRARSEAVATLAGKTISEAIDDGDSLTIRFTDGTNLRVDEAQMHLVIEVK